ncbi:hypothetical protein ACFQS7_27600 [Dankookia sp. GCM10030260]|uniref:hypothetical protein n=1 Tax=Dankookia sp. GCM10030260 TaxID=3273390 RepID=UPI00361FC9FD
MHWIDPDCLPEVAGTVERLVANPRGEADGMLLRDGTLVHVPPHLSAVLRGTVAPGSAVRIRGIRPRGVPHMVAAIEVLPEGGAAIHDHGPPEDRARDAWPAPMTAEGLVRVALHGPKGELRGALLEDGTVLRLGLKEAAGVAALLRPGARVAARGHGITTPEGRVLQAEAIGSEPATLAPVKPAKHLRAPRQETPAATPPA